jgi:hypothetical protein
MKLSVRNLALAPRRNCQVDLAKKKNAPATGFASGLAFSPAFSKNFLLTASELENFLTTGAVSFSVPEEVESAGLARAAGGADVVVVLAVSLPPPPLESRLGIAGGGVPDVTETTGELAGDAAFAASTVARSKALLAASEGLDGFGSTISTTAAGLDPVAVVVASFASPALGDSD